MHDERRGQRRQLVTAAGRAPGGGATAIEPPGWAPPPPSPPPLPRLPSPLSLTRRCVCGIPGARGSHPPEAGHTGASTRAALRGARRRGGGYRPILPKETPYVLCRPTTGAGGGPPPLGVLTSCETPPPPPPLPTQANRPRVSRQRRGCLRTRGGVQGRSACRGGGALTWPTLPGHTAKKRAGRAPGGTAPAFRPVSETPRATPTHNLCFGPSRRWRSPRPRTRHKRAPPPARPLERPREAGCPDPAASGPA